MGAGCAKVFKEKVSGAKTDRAELAKVIGRLEPDDVLFCATSLPAIPITHGTRLTSRHASRPSSCGRRQPAVAKKVLITTTSRARATATLSPNQNGRRNHSMS
jgi:hypothetical protein